MRLAPRVLALAGLFVLAVVGLLAPGPIGQIGVYTWLGVFPGLAIARLLLPRTGAVTRTILGLALSPLVSTLAGLALLQAGLDLVTGARLIGVAGWLLVSGAEARTLGRDDLEPESAPWPRAAWLLALAAQPGQQIQNPGRGGACRQRP